MLLLTFLLLHTRAVQSFIGRQASQALSERLGTRVSVGNVDLGFFNRIVIDDIVIDDQQGRQMLKAGRVAAKVDLLPLAKGKITISSAQLFGLKADLYQADADSKTNFQFVIDSLSSKDRQEHKPLDLQVKSLIIRNGELTWNRLDKPRTTATINPAHLAVSNITAHLVLDQLTDDRLNLNIKRLSMKERSGLDIRKLTAKIVADKQKASVRNFTIELPATTLTSDRLTVKFGQKFDDKGIDMQHIQYDGTLQASAITPSDFTWIAPHADKLKETFNLVSSFSGTSSSLLVDNLKLNTKSNNISLNLSGSCQKRIDAPQWFAKIQRLHINDEGATHLLQALENTIPAKATDILRNIHHIDFTGEGYSRAEHMAVNGTLSTGIGDAKLAISKRFDALSADVATESIHLGKLLGDDTFGMVAADISLKTTLGHTLNDAAIKASAPRFDYRGYTYRNISVDGKALLDASYSPVAFNGKAALDDANGNINFDGNIDLRSSSPQLKGNLQVSNLNPAILGLTDKWAGNRLDFTADADMKGLDLNNAIGTLDIHDFRRSTDTGHYALDRLSITQSGTGAGARHLSVVGDFGELHADGHYNYTSLQHSLVNLIRTKLPTLPGLPAAKSPAANNISVTANIHNSDWLTQLFDIPVTLSSPLTLDGNIDDEQGQYHLDARIPAFYYDGAPYRDADLHIATRGDTLCSTLAVKKAMDNGQVFSWLLKADAADNNLTAAVSFDNHAKRPLRGTINAVANLYKVDGRSTAAIHIKPSDFIVGDTIWNVLPSQVLYDGQRLVADHVVIRHDRQYLDINGTATKSHDDTLAVSLQDIDVSYILDMVNFHSVQFSGLATGKAHITGAFATPEAEARLTVSDFRFQNGPMGTLHAFARLNNEAKRIDLTATADESLYAKTLINGYISPQNNYIDLGIDTQNTNLAFVESFCKSFMRDVDARGNGHVRVFGPLKTIYVPYMGGTRPEAVNLSGMVVADGTVGMKPLGTVYTLRRDTIRLVPDEISFVNDTIFDRDGHHGIVNGKLYHTNLKHLTYDIGISAANLLAYDRKQFGDDTFCGTVYATGNCRLNGGNGETNIDIEVSPEAGTIFRYNASSPDGIRDNQFITWRAKASPQPSTEGTAEEPSSPATQTEATSPMHINFLIHANPNATLDVLMDEESGDNIALHGNGTLRATWFNKGSFDMFGNYVVTDGTYKLSVQNVIKKEFLFSSGGTIAFGGDPYDAQLDLKAVYTINGVPLSDLNIGRSFTSNNIRVNCLMNIGGTPAQPHVDFDLDMPTISADARQMVHSLINSEEEMNQQVIYLLAVGRFLNQGANNAAESTPQQQSQTALAMQSLLSGTISQQLNYILSNTLNTNNWNFGANISTGDEGFNNAQYEGILSGRMLNNRLLINGEFGYRDNANATTSFIGDFDIRYLLRPNGSLAVKVYNQTNDRYFTRNSLNTQGVGLILKKDFGSWKELFKIKKKKKKKKAYPQALPKEGEPNPQGKEHESLH